MTEIDFLIAGAVGGFLSSAVMTLAFLGHIKAVYDKKLKSLQLQLIALRAELNSGYQE